MIINGEDLIQGNYYIFEARGVSQYVGTRLYKEISYHVFLFLNNEKLYLSEQDLKAACITKCYIQYPTLSPLGNNTLWIRNQNKVLAQMQVLSKTTKSLLQIEGYRNILIYGIKNNKILIEQRFNKIYSNDEELNDFIKSVLQNSIYPEGYNKNIEVEYEYSSKTAIINYKIPNTVDVPKTIKSKYDSISDKLIEIGMKDKEFNKYYESIVFQITLRSIMEVFASSANLILEAIVFNGWVTAINKKTGNNFTCCIISLMVSRNQFEKLNLSQVSLKDCILYLKGIFSGNLYQLAPVKPILDINRNDKRFITNKEILSELDEGVNLANMDWEDFEYLVREIFEKIFSNEGSEVKVTQASRDGGVDAIAFDNDPIRGGKFIIQAKRYNNVVPVSAVRDLYGAVINEGAVKGILVTTSYYGNDSREFAKDKPISLIDGSNLVYLLNKYGYKAHIKLKEK